MEKSEFIKDSIKRILGMMVMILVFAIGIFVLYFSSLLVGQQEMLKTTGEEFIIYLDDEEEHEVMSRTESTTSGEKDDNTGVRVVKPLAPVEGVL